jgi:hypothetical protein
MPVFEVRQMQGGTDDVAQFRGLAMVWRHVRQRPVRIAKPRSPRQRIDVFSYGHGRAIA